MRIVSWGLILISVPLFIGFLVTAFSDTGTNYFEIMLISELVVLGPLGLLYTNKGYKGGIASILGVLAVAVGLLFIPFALTENFDDDDFYACVALGTIFLACGSALILSGHKHHQLKCSLQQISESSGQPDSSDIP